VPCSLNVPLKVPCYKEKKEAILPFKEELENIMKSKLHIIKSELYISYTSIISQDMCSLSNSIKHYKCSLLRCVNDTQIKFLSQHNRSE